MKTYKLKITRTRVDYGYVLIEAENDDDAIRKYMEPDYNKGEYLIFDDEIEWEDSAAEYDYDVVICDRKE